MNLLTATEVAQILRVSKARVYELARQRMLPALTLGQRQIRFEEAALREWIAAGGSTISTKTGGANKGGIAGAIAPSAL
jgi:excisionase family DNA binding protein